MLTRPDLTVTYRSHVYELMVHGRWLTRVRALQLVHTHPILSSSLFSLLSSPFSHSSNPLTTMPPMTSDGTNPYPTAPQIRDAYSQLPLQFGKQSFPNPKFNSNSRFKYKSKSKSRGKFPSSASGSNCTPLSTPEEVEARNQASNAWKVGRAPSKFEDVGGFRIPVQPLSEIEGRDLRDNKVLAEGLKMMLEDEFVSQFNKLELPELIF